MSGIAAGELTKRQQEILDFIRKYREKNGYSPGLRDIMAEFGFSSSNGVAGHLRALKKKGRLTWDPKHARTLMLTGEKDTIVQIVGNKMRIKIDGLFSAEDAAGLAIVIQTAGEEL
jgi:repressor LexA